MNEIDALLPQTQCKECGYPGCLPYAEALAQGLSSIDKCPPGGVNTVKALGKLLNIDPSPFLAKALKETRPPSLAIIREAECIGCTKCIQACPVDAIIGSSQVMHSILNHECTGCGLCVEPCPVDCIEMVTQPVASYSPDVARRRFHAKKIRALQEDHERQKAYREKRSLAPLSADETQDKTAKQDYIQQALLRTKAKKSRHE